ISPGDWHQQHVSGVAGVRRPNTLLRNTGSPFARVYYESRMSALIFYRRFCQTGLLLQAIRANSALYAEFAKSLFARFYAKLIPRFGTYFSWLERCPVVG